jgi:DNA-binding IclR family transcriptional regulator
MMPPAVHRVLACLLLAGCALVDQRTFAPAPEAKAQAQAAAPAPVRVDARQPLVTIDFSGPAPQYEELLRYAVRAAETRDRGVQYDVVGMLPSATDAAAGQADAAQVMRAIMLAGVPAARIHLGLQADPSLTGREVRVYVR